jgi:hypothetical protein
MYVGLMLSRYSPKSNIITGTFSEKLVSLLFHSENTYDTVFTRERDFRK